MKYRSIIIGLLARDCRDSVLRNQPRIERLGAYFEDYQVVAVENDSVDGTQQVLRDWAAENSRVVVDSFTDHSQRLADSSETRISHMVWLRNRLLEDIRQLPAPDLVMMMDIDIYGFDVEGVIDSIHQAPDGWGALLANGRFMLPNGQYLKSQYDQYAFLACDEEMDATLHFLPRRGRRLDLQVQQCDYYPVSSAFGGIGIYRYEAIMNLQYCTVMANNVYHDAFCEHVPFHLKLIENGWQNYVSRRLVVNIGIMKIKPWVAFLLYHCPQAYEILCKIASFLHQMKWR